MPTNKVVPGETEQLFKKNRLMTFAGIGEGCWGDTTQVVNHSVKDLRDSWSRKGRLSAEKYTIFRERT